MRKSNGKSTLTCALALAVLLALPEAVRADRLDIDKCEKGASVAPGDGTRDLLVTGQCNVGEGTFLWRNVNIVEGGTLTFADKPIEFNVAAIVVENGGALVAGSPSAPIGTSPGGKLTIRLWGKDQGSVGGKGVRCVTHRCGVPEAEWTSNGSRKFTMPGTAAPAGDDYFYGYMPLASDDGDMEGYFGYKVLAVSYGGSLQLFGRKGATYMALAESDSGTSWVRLAQTVTPQSCDAAKDECTLHLDRAVDTWEVDDQVVVTTTDYLPGHSEQFAIKSVAPDKRSVVVRGIVKHSHNGTKYPLTGLPARLGIDKSAAETRAAVALLSRSIRIVSGGDTPGSAFPGEPAYSADPPSAPGYFFGGHTIVRQGARRYQVQGVEFHQLGQGGRAMHYPVHFHLARRTPADTFVRDSAVHDSMTRWYVLHGTHGVTLERNVGYKSIGHGYFLEDGTEIDNRLVSNIGIFARAAIDNEQNPRKVPGILAARTGNNLSFADPGAFRTEYVPFYSDYDHPTVFWIMNGWNEFAYNMAAGAGACGACYWLLPGANSGHSRHLKWEGYASLQAAPNGDMGRATERAGLTPLKRFVGNYCSTAATSFNTVGNTTACIGIGAADVPNPDRPLVRAIDNPLAPAPCDQNNPRKQDNTDYESYACVKNPKADDYYPKIGGGGRFPTRCDTPTGDCSTVNTCSPGNLGSCMVTVIDNYTSSFHWTELNFAAIWLRPHWYLVSNSVLTDVINGGLTFVTGGGYTESDIITGHWALAWRNVFIGETQPGNPLASIGSPINPAGLACDSDNGAFSGNHCLVAKEGVSFPKGNFGINQRMFNIYDGPAYQDSNAYLNIRTTTLDCSPGGSPGSVSNCGGSKYLQGPNIGVPRSGTRCYLPHAAIGWKQPNGFYYPPAFHSTNLYFDQVDIRHYVTQPLFKPDTYQTDADKAWQQYCTFSVDMFNNWTDIDRQTELNDDDGSLTGYAETISVNEDPFFNGPKEGFECASAETVKTSPYDFVTAVVYPECLLPGKSCPTVKPAWAQDPNARVPSWNRDCGGPHCYGVPLYRQLVTGSEKASPPAHAPAVRMAGQGTGQRSTLLANNGTYYIDTTVSTERQSAPAPIQRSSLNVFQPGGTYYTFLVFAKPTTTQTYQAYVGTKDFNLATDAWPVKVDIRKDPPQYSAPTLPAGQTWPDGWEASYKDGILTVKMSMAFEGFSGKWVEAQQRSCGPASFCALKGGDCACALDANGNKKDPLCHDQVCSWAGNDADCPEGGCWGFGFRLPGSFQTDPPGNPRPSPQCFDATKGWGAPWRPASRELAGSCHLAANKPDDFCP